MDFVYSQSPWVLPKDPEGTEKIFSDHGWKVTFNDHEVIPFGLKNGFISSEKDFSPRWPAAPGTSAVWSGFFRRALRSEPSALSHSPAMRCP